VDICLKSLAGLIREICRHACSVYRNPAARNLLATLERMPGHGDRRGAARLRVEVAALPRAEGGPAQGGVVAAGAAVAVVALGGEHQQLAQPQAAAEAGVRRLEHLVGVVLLDAGQAVRHADGRLQDLLVDLLLLGRQHQRADRAVQPQQGQVELAGVHLRVGDGGGAQLAQLGDLLRVADVPLGAEAVRSWMYSTRRFSASMAAIFCSKDDGPAGSAAGAGAGGGAGGAGRGGAAAPSRPSRPPRGAAGWPGSALRVVAVGLEPCVKRHRRPPASAVSCP
jgi:hypothetical protein